MNREQRNKPSMVERPARYTGNEWNIVRKTDPVSCRIALAFPNTYEIGMSHLGLRILYNLVNSIDELALERVFCPWPDKEKQIRESGEGLLTLETKRSPRECDLFGFTLQSELDFTNVLTMLDLADLPLRASDRSTNYPLVIGGGPVVFNPEPLAPFFDLFLIGDAEESLPALMKSLAVLKSKNLEKQHILTELEKIPGVYAPGLHETEIDPESGLEVIQENVVDEPIIQKAMLADLDDHPFPHEMLVPYCDIVHDRVAVEISRGCSRGCRFCQAGVIYMPERRRSPQSILNSVGDMLKSSGYNSVSVTALTPNDHPQLREMLEVMSRQFGEDSISVALASLSPSNMDEELLNIAGGVKKSGLTIAPEAGSQRLREVINKGITEEDILETATAAFKLGWKAVKLYFMIGLPTETDEDVLAIAKLAKRVASLHKGVSVKIGCSNFVPKSHTPFQWVAMESSEELQRKKSLLLKAISGDRRIAFTSHDLEESTLEAILSRGDRRLADAIEFAWEKGCRFDGWKEHRQMDNWEEALQEASINKEYFTSRPLPPFARLPWSHIGTGVKPEYLREEYQRALAGVEHVRCKPANCPKCRACPPELLKEKWQASQSEAPATLLMPDVTVKRKGPLQAFRLRFHKTIDMAFLGHLDLARLFARLFRRAGIAVKHSQGFNPQPKISFPSALPLGQEGRNEYCEVSLYFEGNEAELCKQLNMVSPDGLIFTGALKLEPGESSLASRLSASEYVINRPAGRTFNKEALEHFMASREVEWLRIHKGKHKRFNIREHVLQLENGNGWGELHLRLKIMEGLRARPEEVMAAIYGTEDRAFTVRRENLLIEREGALYPPM
jgi:radical SAM family uncharacterized protein/radical SAM-linked protein